MGIRSISARRLSLLLIIMLIISAFPVNGIEKAYAETPTASVGSVTDLTAEPGEEVTVPINISDNPGIAGMYLVLTYDQDKLTPVSVDPTELTQATIDPDAPDQPGSTCMDSISSSSDNSFKIVWISYENMTDNGTVFNVKFRLSEYASGNTKIGLSYKKKDTYNEDFHNVTLNCSDILLNITEKQSDVTTISSIQDQTVNAGENISIPIKINNVDNLDSLSFDLKYDKSVFSLFTVYNDGIGYGIHDSIYEGFHFDVYEIDTSVTNGTLFHVVLSTKAYESGSFVFTLSSEDVGTQNFRVKVVNNQVDENATVYCGQWGSASNDTVAFRVRIRNNHGIAAFRFSVGYDPEKIVPTSVQQGSELKGTFRNTVGKKENSFDVIWFNPDNYNDDGVLFVMFFRIVEGATGTAAIDLDYSEPDTCDEHLNDVMLNMEDYEFQLGDKHVTSITAQKTKTEYFVGDKFNFDDITVIAHYSDGSSDLVTDRSRIIINTPSGMMNQPGDYTSGVSYVEGLFSAGCKVNITVKAVVDSISVSKTKIDYHVGDKLNIDDLTVTAAYTHGESTEITDYTTNAADIDMNTTGDKTLIISYTENGITVTSSVILHVTPVLTSITATKAKTEYNEGDALGLNDIIVIAHYSDNTEEQVNDYTTNASDIDMTEPGNKTLIITYSEDGSDYTAEIPITVAAIIDHSLKSINVEKTKKQYYVGQELGVDDLTVTALYNDGNSRTVTNYVTNVQNIDMATSGDRTLVVTYTEDGKTVTGSVNIIVKAQPQSMSVIKTKILYDYGEEIGIDDLKVLINYTDGTQKEVSGYQTNLSEIDVTTSGIKTLTVSYTENERTVSQDVLITLRAVLTSIDVEKAKIDYNVGEELAIDDLTVTAQYNDSTSTIVTDYTTNKDAVDMNTAGDKALVVSYTENGKTVTKSVIIHVTAVLSGITASKGRTQFNVDEELNTDDLVVIAHYSDNSDKAVSGYTTNAADIDMSSAGNKTLVVTYAEGGVQKTAEIEIEVNEVVDDSLKSISVEKEKKSYNVGESLSIDDMTVTASYYDGTSKEVTDYTTNVSLIDMSTAGTKTLVVTYTEEGKTVSASVVISVKAEPLYLTVFKTKTTYAFAEGLNINDLTVYVKYSDNTQKQVTGYTTNEAEIDMSSVGTHALIVSYTEDGKTVTGSIDITVIKELAIITPSLNEMDFNVGDDLDITDLFVWAIYSDGTSEMVKSGFTSNAASIDMDTAGDKALILTYSEGDKTCSTSITVHVKSVITSIKASKIQTEYTVNQQISLDDLIVTAQYSDNTVKEIDSYTTNVADIDMSELGEKTLVITYVENGNKFTDEVTITVIDEAVASLESIQIEKQKTAYHIGEALSVDDMTVTALYSDGTSSAVTGYTTNASDIDMSTAGTKTLLVTYEENGRKVMGTVSISVKAELSSIRALKTKTIYNYQDILNINDLTVLASYTDGTQKEVTGYITNAADIDMSLAGDKTLTITYSENGKTVTCDVNITVRKILASISVQKEKTVYKTGSTLGVDDITVTAAYTDGTAATVSGYMTNADDIDMSTEGSKTLIVVYEENGRMATSSIVLTVSDTAEPDEVELSSIRVIKEKKNYYVGETLNLEDIIVLASYSDDTQKEVTEFTTNATSINMNIVGNKTLTVNYEENGKTVSASITIIVSEKVLLPVSLEIEGNTVYYVDQHIDLDEFTVTAHYSDGSSKIVSRSPYQQNHYTTNISDIDMAIAGNKDLVFTYTENGKTVIKTVVITVKKKINIKNATIKGIHNVVYTKDTDALARKYVKSIEVWYKGERLVKEDEVDFDDDYDYSTFCYCDDVGNGSITIYGEGIFTGSVTKTFKVLPKGTSLKKLYKRRKSMKVTWKKQSMKMSLFRIDGYQIRYSTSSKMKKAKTVRVKGYKKTSRIIKNLKARRKYYVQIRTYMKYGKKNYYSKWSKKKSVRTY